MKVWIVRDVEENIVDCFSSLESTVSYISAEIERWREEYPEYITEDKKCELKKQLTNRTSPNHYFFVETSPDFYLEAMPLEAKD